MTNEQILKNRMLRGVLAASASALALNAAGLAYAQVDQIPDAEAADETTEDTIIVTGSRIARAGVDTVRPALSVGNEELDKRAFTNIADALNEIPTFGAGISPNGPQNGFTVGQNFVDLFDLGSQRTLTLVNGRRFVSTNTPVSFGTAGGLQVDFNVIPVSLLERIEVVPLAGAAVYGSDAIAGTINVILRDDFEGFEISGQYGVTEEGDGEQYQVQAVYGANTADGRGNVVFSVEYANDQGLRLIDRPNFTINDPNLVSFGTGAGVDVDGDGDVDQEFRIDQNQVVQLFGEFGSVSPTALNIPSIGLGSLADGNFYQFDAQGSLNSCTPGRSPGASSLFFAQESGCGIDFFDSVAQITSPVERVVFSSVGHYDLMDNVRVFAETTFANSRAVEFFNQGGFQTFAFGDSSAALTFDTSNPFLTNQARSIIEGNGLTSFAVNRFNNDIVSSGENSTENFVWRVATGLEGDFEFAERQFDWEISTVFGESDVETRSLGIVDGRFFNAIDAVRLDATSLQPIIDAGFASTTDEALDFFNQNSLSGVSNAQLGNIVCQANIDIAAGTNDGFNTSPGGGGIDANAFPFADGCLPLNLFGDARLLNSQETLEFINGGPRITSSDLEQRVFTATITGEVVELPAGWVSMNGGFETRRERAVFTPGLGTTLNITRSSPFIETGGQSTTREWFGEIFVPIVNKDMGIPFLEMFEANASVRRVNNRITDINRPGKNEETDKAYEFGGRFSPVEDVIFRGSFTSAIRTPALVELFAPEVQAFLFADDPCDFRFITGGLVPATRAANCAAAGITQPFTSNVVNATIIGKDSGNPDLLPERSKAFNVGAIFQPRWIDNFVLQLDFFRINIEDRITPLGLTQILNACFDSPSFPNTPACSDELFRRDATGQVVFGKTTQLNAGFSQYKGVQGQMRYLWDVADAFNAMPGMKNSGFGNNDLGEIEFNVTILRAIKNEVRILDEEPTDPIGSFDDPKWQGTFDTTYRRGPLRIFWRTIWQDKPLFSTTGNSFLSNLDPTDTADSTLANVIDGLQSDRLIHNASISYTLFDTTTVQVSVNNVFDRFPDRIDFASGNFGTSEQRGRSYVFRVRSQF
ncbi:MAG: TonB-dependent receptor domain-containing protein [Parvularculaceae bacterium]